MVYNGILLWIITQIYDQDQYNLIFGTIIDRKCIDLSEKYEIIDWSPFKGGILTSKYFDNQIPSGSIMDNKNIVFLTKILEKIKKICELKLKQFQIFTKEQ